MVMTMAFDVHVFTSREGEMKAAITLSNGQRTKPRHLSKRNTAVLLALLLEHRVYTKIKPAKGTP